MNPVPLNPMAFTATPTSSNEITEIRFAFLAIAYTAYVASNAPANANSGTSIGPVISLNLTLKLAAHTKTMDAPKAAPALVPASPDSAHSKYCSRNGA
jgi:hypothetical protein